MKKTFLALIILFQITVSGSLIAHEHHSDSISMSALDTLMMKEVASQQEVEAVEEFPNYHPLIVHFPIVLLLMAAIFQLLSLFVLKREFSIVTIILLALGVVTTWLASNPLHAMPGMLTGSAKEIFETHELMASLTWWISLLALVIKITSHYFLKEKWWLEFAATILLIGSGVTVSIAGHHGSMLVHMEGVGPLGKYLGNYRLPVQDEVVPTAENLSEQDEKSDTSVPAIPPENNAQTTNPEKEIKRSAADKSHHVGEQGKGPHGGTIEKAEPYHMEMGVYGSDLVFYLLDNNAKPLNMNGVTGKVTLQYSNNQKKTIELMEMGGKQTAMQAINGLPFTAQCTLTREGKSYTATFNSQKDLPKIN